MKKSPCRDRRWSAALIHKKMAIYLKGKIMSEIPNVFTDMTAAWNERDLNQIKSHVDKCMAENVVFADPVNFFHGRNAFEKMVKEFRLKYPESKVIRTSGLDSHNRRYRYTWEILVGETLIIKGQDFVQLDENGLIERIDGFFGDLPPIEN